MVVLVSFARDGRWTTQVLPPEYTLDNYRRLITESQLWKPIMNSVWMALIATAANVIVCFVAAYLIVMRKFAGRRLLGDSDGASVGDSRDGDRAWPCRDIQQERSRLSARMLLVGTFWILPLCVLRTQHPARVDCGRKLAAPDGCVTRGCSARARRIMVAHDEAGNSAGSATGPHRGGFARGGHSGWRVRGERGALHPCESGRSHSRYSRSCALSHLALLRRTACLLILLVLGMTLTARSFEERIA